MHTFPVLASGLALLATATFASPLEEAQARSSYCISHDQAWTVANDFGTLISDYSTTLANTIIASDYSEQSDSVNTLIDNGGTSPDALGSITFATKQAFENGQGGQPSVPFTILDLWHTCDTVIIRWVSDQTPEQVQGFTALEVCPGPKGTPYQISKAWAEFNTGAWLANLGHPECK